MLVMRYIFRVDAEPLTEYCKECEMTKCTRDQKVALLLFVGLIILILVRCRWAQSPSSFPSSALLVTA